MGEKFNTGKVLKFVQYSENKIIFAISHWLNYLKIDMLELYQVLLKFYSCYTNELKGLLSLNGPNKKNMQRRFYFKMWCNSYVIRNTMSCFGQIETNSNTEILM